MILHITQDQRNTCIEIAELLQAVGGRALLIGGCVRDSLLSIPAKDVDMEVYGLSTDEIEQALQQKFRLDTVGRSFGVLIVKGQNIDITLPRRESKVGPKHTDFVVEGDPSMSPGEAASRRDFTINAISFDPLAEELIDPCQGRGGMVRGHNPDCAPMGDQCILHALRPNSEDLFLAIAPDQATGFRQGFVVECIDGEDHQKDGDPRAGHLRLAQLNYIQAQDDQPKGGHQPV